MILNQEFFEEIILKNKKVIIILGHPLCQPCQRLFFLVPVLFIRSKFKGRVLRFCNVREVPEIALKYNITTTPTLLYFENQKEKNRITDPFEIYIFF
jgi:thiol-disulfide isomerase/thioredoxin